TVNNETPNMTPPIFQIYGISPSTTPLSTMLPINVGNNKLDNACAKTRINTRTSIPLYGDRFSTITFIAHLLLQRHIANLSCIPASHYMLLARTRSSLILPLHSTSPYARYTGKSRKR